MKLRAPEGTASFSYAGEESFVAADGTVEVEGEASDALLCHGFEPVRDLAQMSRDDLIERILARSRIELAALATEKLRGQFSASIEADRDAEDKFFLVDASPVSADRIASMTRRQLFAFLREKGIAAGAVGNEALRAIALQTLGPPEAVSSELDASSPGAPEPKPAA